MGANIMKSLIQEKILMVNTGVLTLSFMGLEQKLQIVLFCLTIILTLIKIYKETKK